MHSYIQYLRHLTSCITSNPPNEQTFFTLFMQGLMHGSVRTYLFPLEIDIVEEAIRVAERKYFSVK